MFLIAKCEPPEFQYHFDECPEKAECICEPSKWSHWAGICRPYCSSHSGQDRSRTLMNILSCKASNLTTPELSESKHCQNVVNGCDALKKKHLIRKKLRKGPVESPWPFQYLFVYEFINSLWIGLEIKLFCCSKIFGCTTTMNCDIYFHYCIRAFKNKLVIFVKT